MGHISSTEKDVSPIGKDDKGGFPPAHVFAVVENTEEVNLSDEMEQAPFIKIGLITSDQPYDMSLIPRCYFSDWGSFCNGFAVIVCSSPQL